MNQNEHSGGIESASKNGDPGLIFNQYGNFQEHSDTRGYYDLDQTSLSSGSSSFQPIQSFLQTKKNSVALPNAFPKDSSNIGEIIGMDPREQLHFFENIYVPHNAAAFNVKQLLIDQCLKLKRYKQSVFFGQYVNSKRHGIGVMVYNNGRLYEGMWENDLKHGKGFERFQNGSTYDGQFINGKPEGIGVYNFHNGEIYDGQWINGMKHGSGIWRGTKNDSYIGEWKFGKPDGYGVHTWINGDRYEGQFKGSLKHGEGTEKFKNGDVYIGNYINGKPEGYGEYYWQNQSFFKGYFKNGLRDGKGAWKRGPGNADSYEGEYVNDKKCGYGVFTWASGNVYKGNYFEDLRHGYGEMTWTDNSYYKGAWERGIQNGEGEMCLPGDVPKQGIFQNNVYMGQTDDSNEQRPLKQQIRSSYWDMSANNPGGQKQLLKEPNNNLPNIVVYQPKKQRASTANNSKTGTVKQQQKQFQELKRGSTAQEERKFKNNSRVIKPAKSFSEQNSNIGTTKASTARSSINKHQISNTTNGANGYFTTKSSLATSNVNSLINTKKQGEIIILKPYSSPNTNRKQQQSARSTSNHSRIATYSPPILQKNPNTRKNQISTTARISRMPKLGISVERIPGSHCSRADKEQANYLSKNY